MKGIGMIPEMPGTTFEGDGAIAHGEMALQGQMSLQGNLSWQNKSFLQGRLDPALLGDEQLSDLFAASLAADPDKILYTSGARVLTYAETDALSTRIARRLSAQGAKPGAVIGLWMPRGIDLLIAQLAITKTGAAFLPFDADAPVERIATCLSDAEALGLLCAKAGLPHAQLAGLNGFVFEGLSEDENAEEADLIRAKPEDAAYLIYTSGSTGIPKGIVITQRNICHFLRASNSIYAVIAQDVVFQSASLAFDLSMEEIWVPYLAGASLYVATSDILADLEALPKLLSDHKITVIDTVPTLLAMLGSDIPSLRLILLGGEALPPALVELWSKPGRRIFNTYGPTEATVVASVAEVLPAQGVTIGVPIPNHTCYVVDEALNLLDRGETGELLIGGPGVANGYLKRDDLTAQKFIPNPFLDLNAPNPVDPVLYRSGDGVKIDTDGNLVFFGRIDDQVKIRGFRVELGEIESALCDCADIAQAATVLRGESGIDRLVAFVVLKPESIFVPSVLREELRRRLPPYMLPERFEPVESLPRMISGKIDRKALKAMTLVDAPIATDVEDHPQTHTEALLLDAAKRVLPGRAIQLEADFFIDLGGHSLIAAQFVSIMRENPAFTGITLQDIYQQRNLRALGDALDSRFGDASAPPPDLGFAPPPKLRRVLCTIAQAVLLPIILTISTLQWLGIFVTYMMISELDYGFWKEAAVLSGAFVSIKFGTLFLVVALKWLVLGRTKPGQYPLWGVYFLRWWFVQRLYALVHPSYLANTPMMRLFLRLMGAKIGAGVMIAHAEFGAADLIKIGSGTSIGHKANLANAEIVAGQLVIERIAIGKDVYIGNQVVIAGGCTVGHDARLEDMTALAQGMKIAPCEHWDGSPARKIGMIDRASLPEISQPGPIWKIAQYPVYAVFIVLISAIGLLPLFPAFFVYDAVEDLLTQSVSFLEWYHVLPIVTWIMGAALVVFTLIFVVAIRWVVLPFRLKEGTVSIHSRAYFRQWIVTLATEVSLDTLSSLYATTYMRGWYRLMGCSIGKGAEISTNLGARYDLISIGAGSFIADECSLGDEDTFRGWMSMKKTRLEDRVFIGNNAVIAHGSHFAPGTLIGVKSKGPDSLITAPDTTWFGSPAIQFPVRQKFGAIDANLTYAPSWRMKLGRAVFEALHTTFPTMLFLTLGSIAVYFFINPAYEEELYGEAIGWFVLASIVMPVIMVLIVCAIKWLLMGKYGPVAKPMWSWWAMKTEAVAVLYWGLGGKVLLEHLRGTAFLPLFLRLFGAKIGKGVYMDTTDITEFDCVTIGDYVAMNDKSCLQTHLYEDRIMKVGRIDVEAGVSIGAFATVLYDSKIGAYARLQPLTMIMKGENIPPHTIWHGIPAVPDKAHG
jgi:non-ribosomal peptide synthetase-like protein